MLLKKWIPAFLIFSQGLPAQAGFWLTTWNEVASPFTTEAKYYLLGGSALTGILVYDKVEDKLGHSVEGETVENRPLGSMSRFGDLSGQMIPNAIYAATFYGIGYFNDDPIATRRSAHMLKATLYSGLSATVIKHIVREPRPDSNNRDSFPSGHTTSAFAFAAVVGTEHEWYWGAAAYGLAGLVAYSRINDNAHRLHDVVGGATLGLTYGLSLHYLYKDEKSPIAKFSVTPLYDGFMFGYRTEF